MAAAAFKDSERHRRLLAFLVETSLRGEADGLKEFVIAAEVWGRDVSFDPRIHSTVRVEVGRLRARLARHYAADGANDPIRFRIPTGGYAVIFESPDPNTLAASHSAASPILDTPPGTPSENRGHSHFEIIELLGRGGMGEVWKARDRRLGRDVALKFISRDLAGNPAARERFEREARAAAALNHPNICTVYDVGETGGQPFLAMELLDGETLEQRLAKETVPVASLLDWGIEIADALEAAHTRGIIHSDLKPANLFLTARGQTKILDFGLARLLSETKAEPGAQASHAAGTPGYMSPEQKNGEPLDSRSDIYSLGIVLYRAAAGRLPETSSDAPSSRNPLVPPDLDRIIGKALEADREVRYQHASELRADLKRLKRDSDAGLLRQTVAAEEASKRRRQLPFTVSIALSFAAALILAAGVFAYLRLNAHAPFQHFQITRMTDTEDVQLTAISPDGKYLATVRKNASGKQSLWIHHLPSESERQLLENQDYDYVRIAFSPDSTYIYFRALAKSHGDGLHRASEVYRVPVIGGDSMPVFQNVHSQLTFIDGGKRVCFYRGDGANHQFFFVDASIDGGDEKILYSEKGPLPGISACSPDGKRAALTYHQDKIEILDFASRQRKAFYLPPTNRWSVYGINWMPDGKGLVIATASRGTLLLQLGYVSYPAGVFHEITNNLNTYVHGVTLTADGKTLAATESREESSFSVGPAANPGVAKESPWKWIESSSWLDRQTLIGAAADGTLKRVDLATGAATAPHLPQNYFFADPAACGPNSDKDSFVASGGPRDTPIQSIFRMSSDGGNLRQLTPGPVDAYPRCTPDGKWLLYVDLRVAENPKVMRVPLAGGTPQIVVDGIALAISPDGKLLAVAHYDRGPVFTWYSIATWEKIQQTSLQNWPSQSISFAPDNASLLFATSQNGVGQLWQQPFDQQPAKLLASFPGREIKNLSSSPNGSQIAFTSVAAHADAVILQDRPR